MTLDDFTAKFKEQLDPEVIMAMRDLFHLDDKAINVMEDALIDRAGEGALELASAHEGAALQGDATLEAA